MLIISQDKESITNLDNLKDIWISAQEDRRVYDKNIKIYLDKSSEDKNSAYFVIYGDETLLGKYKTKQRAKEILKELTEMYEGKTLIRFNANLGKNKIKELMEEYKTHSIVVTDKTYTIKKDKNLIYYMPER